MSDRHAGSAVGRASASIAAVMVCVLSLAAQAPLPPARVRGQGPAPVQAAPALPDAPVVAPRADASPATGAPGEMFPSLMALPAASDMARSGYTTQEFIVSGTANGQPYRTRMVLRRPINDS